MSSVYPGTLDSLATNKANATPQVNDHPQHHDDLADAINKMEAELGTDPSGASATVKARLTAIEASTLVVTSNSQSGTYTLVLTDAGKVIEFTAAGTLTVPTNATVAFPVDTVIEVNRYGAGAVSVAPVSGTVTIRSPGGLLNLASQYSSASLRKRGTNEWILSGDLA